MDATISSKLATNATNVWRMASAWVMTAAGAVFATYLYLPPEQQQAVIAHLPVPPWVLPIVATVLGILARLWPQKSVTATVAAAKSADAPIEGGPPTP